MKTTYQQNSRLQGELPTHHSRILKMRNSMQQKLGLNSVLMTDSLASRVAWSL